MEVFIFFADGMPGYLTVAVAKDEDAARTMAMETTAKNYGPSKLDLAGRAPVGVANVIGVSLE